MGDYASQAMGWNDGLVVDSEERPHGLEDNRFAGSAVALNEEPSLLLLHTSCTLVWKAVRDGVPQLGMDCHSWVHHKCPDESVQVVVVAYFVLEAAVEQRFSRLGHQHNHKQQALGYSSQTGELQSKEPA